MPYSSAKDSFINKRCLLNSSIDFTYFSFTEQIENTIRRLNLEEDLNNSTFNVEETESVHFDHEFFLQSIMQSMNFNVENEHSEHIPFENNMHLHSLSCSLSLNDFHSSVTKMTKSQLEVLEHVKLKYEGKSFPFYVFVSGGAGVGKSFLTKAIVAYLCTNRYSCQ